MEAEDPLPSSQEPATGPFRKVQSTSSHLISVRYILILSLQSLG